ncbi:glycosyltransferase [Roseburia hominis]|uniref:glycosyltransferase family 2 protein n=1 Tax=Roseburia hominis TaxID=301301 RepID=UPI001F179676|nr:glycosyltransferase [Roseburia hominis]
MRERYKKKKGRIEDVLLKPKEDRRKLSNVPDKTNTRSNIDRRNITEIDRNTDMEAFIKSAKSGIRYQVDYEVLLILKDKKGKKRKIHTRGIDISASGILLRCNEEKWLEAVEYAKKIWIKFEITPGSMPEGYEMKVKIPVHFVRAVKTDEETMGGFAFEKTLAQYAAKRKDAMMLTTASILITFICVFIVMMRAESVIYFKFNKGLYLYSIIAATFLLSRYFFGAMYKVTPIDMEFEPGVTIIIPCFNEEKWIKRTILSCVNQDYPMDKLEVIVVDDCSNDHSVEKIKETIQELKSEGSRYEIENRVSYIVQRENKGKREALCEGVKVAKHELVVFVDSDSFLDPFAIRNLIQPFRDSKMGGVAGRCDVANTYTNYLTKMQSVRYYIAFRVMKAAEAYFDAVTCLSGPLSAYRRQIVLDHMEEWRNQKFLGQRATFGDDRAMTNIVLSHYRTGYQDTAYCSTIVPNTNKVFLKQQMRWKRSWLRESIMAGKFMWRKEPFAALFFYIGLFVPVAAPVVVVYNLIYVPIIQHIFPTTFLVGLLLMSGLMSVVQLLLRRSTTWWYGFVFCIYYELILLWQMPVAWFTFWKSTWGTRLTPADIAEEEKKKQKEQEKQKKRLRGEV